MAKYSRLSRRDFICNGAAAWAAFTIIPRHVLGGTGYVAPSGKINVAVIGCGGQGRTNIRQLLQFDDVQIVAIADPVDSEDYTNFYYGGQGGRLPVKQEIEEHYRKTNPHFTCTDYKDFRELFDKEKNIDAVLCATPDHWHAFITMAALKRGKHIYCEKPLTHNIREARLIAKAAKEAKVATQMGNQGHSDEGNRLMSEWIADGAIGNVKEVYAWSLHPGHSTQTSRLPAPRLPKGTFEVPDRIDWNLWRGPRACLYNPEYIPVRWRYWWAFGTGVVGDLAIHHMDPAYTALMPGQPTWIQANPSWIDDEATPSNNRVEWFFEKTDSRPEVRFIWLDGNQELQRPEELEPERKMGENGVLVIGDKGKILGGGWSNSPRIIPEAKMKAYKRPAKTLRRSPGHHREWLDAIKGGPEPTSNFTFGAILTEFVHLGNLALRSGKKIEWDADAMKVKGCPELDKYIQGEYPQGWDLNNI